MRKRKRLELVREHGAVGAWLRLEEVTGDYKESRRELESAQVAAGDDSTKEAYATRWQKVHDANTRELESAIHDFGYALTRRLEMHTHIIHNMDSRSV